MVILVKRSLSRYAEKQSTVAGPLNNWYEIVKAANWKSLTDIKRMFNIGLGRICAKAYSYWF